MMEVDVVGPVTLLAVMPWLARNYRTFGQFVFLRSNFGLASWTPGTYDIVVTLRDAATQNILDQVILLSELIISAPTPAAPAGKLSAVSVMLL
jgi:hypothetical protein